ASSSRAARSSSTRVNAPRSWPNGSDAIRVWGIAAQLTLTNGPLARRDQMWMERASNSLPVPVSPVTRTVESVGATFRARACTACNAADAPTIPTVLSLVSDDGGRIDARSWWRPEPEIARARSLSGTSNQRPTPKDVGRISAFSHHLIHLAFHCVPLER